MTIAHRAIDTGPRPARWNIAMTAALAALHPAGLGAVTLRFQQYPPSVLLGRHQDMAREIRIDRCRVRGVEIARRATGGGTVYMDRGVLAWDVITDRARFGGRLDRASALICAGIARGLARLGVDAVVRAPDAIMVDGRKLCGTSGLVEGPALVFQGTVLIDVDLAALADVLVNAGDVADVADRLTSLARLTGRAVSIETVMRVVEAGLGDGLGVTFSPAPPAEAELALADRLYADQFGSDNFVYSAEAA